MQENHCRFHIREMFSLKATFLHHDRIYPSRNTSGCSLNDFNKLDNSVLVKAIQQNIILNVLR